MGLLSVLELFGYQLGVEKKFFFFFALKDLHHFPALSLLLLLFLEALLVQADSNVKLVLVVCQVLG